MKTRRADLATQYRGRVELLSERSYDIDKYALPGMDARIRIQEWWAVKTDRELRELGGVLLGGGGPPQEVAGERAGEALRK